MKILACLKLILLLVILVLGSPDLFSRGGDRIVSFPIALHNKPDGHYILTFYYQRGFHSYDTPRGWRDYELIGPEGRIIKNGNPDSTLQEPDFLQVDFIFAEKSNIYNLFNPEEENWNNYPDSIGKFTQKGISAFRVYGTGGYRYGYSVNVPKYKINIIKGLYPDIYDDGYDEEFKFAFIPLPENLFKNGEDTIYCRFRLQVNAENNHEYGGINDDDDPFYVDNVRLVKYPCEGLPGKKLEVTALNKKIPYTMIPTGQTNKIPLEIKVQNTTPDTVLNVPMSVKIKKRNIANGWPYDSGEPDSILTSYISKNKISLLPFERKTFKLTPLNMNSGGYIDTFSIGQNNYLAHVLIKEDEKQDKDSNFYKFDIVVGNGFAYDPIQNPRNDVPDNQFSGIAGKGLTLQGYSSGDYDFSKSYGDVGGSGPGRLAMKFVILNRDTLIGYSAYWSVLESGLEDIQYNIYYDNKGVPGKIIQSSKKITYTGYDEDTKQPNFDEYVNAYLKNPVVLDSGVYWMSVMQLGESGFNLGGSRSRMGMIMTNFVNNSPRGSMNTYLLLDKSLRVLDSTGHLGNDNIFAYSNTIDSSDWVPFMPNVGNPGYAHLNYLGLDQFDSVTKTYSRGTWIPMIRPVFKNRKMSINIPRIAVSSDTLDFGKVLTGSNKIKTLKILNKGTDILRIFKIVGNERFFVNDSNVSLLPNESKNLSISFNPLKTGKYIYYLTIFSNDKNVTVKLIGEAISTAKCIINPKFIEFGLVESETIKDTTFAIINSGLDTLHVYSINSRVPFFYVKESRFDVPPGDKYVDTIFFRPIDSGDRFGYFQIETNVSSDSLFVSGRDGRESKPLLRFTPNPVDFGEVYIGSETTKSITIKNVGIDTILIKKFISSSDCFESSENLFKSSPLTQFNFELKFKPKESKSYNEFFAITADDIFDTIFVKGIGKSNTYVADITNISGLHIHPNPATDFIEISVGARRAVSGDANIRIYNVLGEELKNLTPALSEGEGVRIDISDLPSGVYFVRVGEKVSKFIKI